MQIGWNNAGWAILERRVPFRSVLFALWGNTGREASSPSRYRNGQWPEGYTIPAFLLERNPDIRPDLNIIVVRVGQARSEVVPGIDPNFERLPYRILESSAELHAQIEVLCSI